MEIFISEIWLFGFVLLDVFYITSTSDINDTVLPQKRERERESTSGIERTFAIGFLNNSKLLLLSVLLEKYM